MLRVKTITFLLALALRSTEAAPRTDIHKCHDVNTTATTDTTQTFYIYYDMDATWLDKSDGTKAKIATFYSADMADVASCVRKCNEYKGCNSVGWQWRTADKHNCDLYQWDHWSHQESVDGPYGETAIAYSGNMQDVGLSCKLELDWKPPH